MINNDDTALMPCSCGRTNGLTSVKMFEYSYSSHPFYVACTCGMRTQDCKSEKEAREIWNTRPTPQKTPAPAQADAIEKMAKALEMVVHNAAIQRGKKGKAWDGDFVIKQCQSALTEYLAAQDGRCPDCGYTEEDKRLHGDHHLCPRAALQSPPRPLVKPVEFLQEALAAAENYTYPEPWADDRPYSDEEVAALKAIPILIEAARAQLAAQEGE